MGGKKDLPNGLEEPELEEGEEPLPEDAPVVEGKAVLETVKTWGKLTYINEIPGASGKQQQQQQKKKAKKEVVEEESQSPKKGRNQSQNRKRGANKQQSQDEPVDAKKARKTPVKRENTRTITGTITGTTTETTSQRADRTTIITVVDSTTITDRLTCIDRTRTRHSSSNRCTNNSRRLCTIRLPIQERHHRSNTVCQPCTSHRSKLPATSKATTAASDASNTYFDQLIIPKIF